MRLKRSTLICGHAFMTLGGYAIINQTPASDAMKAKYALEGATQIVADLDAMESLGIFPVLGDYLEEENGVARHATARVAHDVLALVIERRMSQVTSTKPRDASKVLE
jgi:hypothetical protein